MTNTMAHRLHRIAWLLLVFSGLSATLGFFADQGDDYISVLTLGANPTQLGLLNAIGGLGFLVAIPLGNVVARFGRPATLLVTYGLIIAGTTTQYLLWLSGHLRVEYLYLTAVIFVVAGIVKDLALDTWWPSAVGVDRAGQYFAKAQTIDLAISAAGPLLVGATLMVLPPTALLLATATVAVASSVVLWRAHHAVISSQASVAVRSAEPGTNATDEESEPPTPPAVTSTKSAWGLMWHNKTVLLSTCAAALSNAGYAFCYGFEFFLLSKVIGLEPFSIGVILSGQALAGVLASWWFDQYGTETRHHALLVVTIAALVLVSAAAWFAASNLSALWVVLVPALVVYHAALSWLRVLSYAMTVRLISEPIRIAVQGVRMTIAMALVPASVLAAASCADYFGFSVVTKIWAIIVLLTALGSGALRVVASRQLQA